MEEYRPFKKKPTYLNPQKEKARLVYFITQFIKHFQIVMQKMQAVHILKTIHSKMPKRGKIQTHHTVRAIMKTPILHIRIYHAKEADIQIYSTHSLTKVLVTPMDQYSETDLTRR